MIYNSNSSTAVLVLKNGKVFTGAGLGAQSMFCGEVCFNTSMTGYQEAITDPSYAGQIINFTFPHIGNVGANETDTESTSTPHAGGIIIREQITDPSNYRSESSLDRWLSENGVVGISGIDTRAVTIAIRDQGAPEGLLYHRRDGKFDINELKEKAKQIPSLEGKDLAAEVTCKKPYQWNKTLWKQREDNNKNANKQASGKHIVVMDFGVKHNILRCLAEYGAKITVVPASCKYDDIISLKPDGIFLSNGPGDPSATGKYASPVIQGLLNTNIPIFGICLGHQLLALSLGAKTKKMHLGHRGANHPVKNIETSRIEITSQNHGFEVVSDSLPKNVRQTHISLFDKSNEGIELKDRKVFSVQYHPESSPGPHDSRYLFDKFINSVCGL